MNIWEFFFQWVGVLTLASIIAIGISSIGPFIINHVHQRHNKDDK